MGRSWRKKKDTGEPSSDDQEDNRRKKRNAASVDDGSHNQDKLNQARRGSNIPRRENRLDRMDWRMPGPMEILRGFRDRLTSSGGQSEGGRSVGAASAEGGVREATTDTLDNGGVGDLNQVRRQDVEKTDDQDSAVVHEEPVSTRLDSPAATTTETQSPLQEIKVIFRKANPESKSPTRFDIQITLPNGSERVLSVVLGNYEEIGKAMKEDKLPFLPWSHRALKMGFLFYEKNGKGLEKQDGALLGTVFDALRKQASMSEQKERSLDGTRQGELEKIGSANIFSSGNTLEEFINWSKEGRGAEELTAVNSMVDKLRNASLSREHKKVMRGMPSEEPMKYVFQEMSVSARPVEGTIGLGAENKY